MPRTPKCRKVCGMPQYISFRSQSTQGSSDSVINLTVEEYETIRLMDYYGLTQEECAEQMQVARTTVQRIYNTARQKMAQFLVEGSDLKIVGGSYEVCNHNHCNCRLKKACCRKQQINRSEEDKNENRSNI